MVVLSLGIQDTVNLQDQSVLKFTALADSSPGRERTLFPEWSPLPLSLQSLFLYLKMNRSPICLLSF